MKFRNIFEPERIAKQINIDDKLFFVGSCFTENICEKFKKHKFQVLHNTHGILFNPLSVAKAVTDCITQKNYTESDIFLYDELWQSWHHHTQFSGTDSKLVLENINASIIEGHNFLKKTDYIIITLGSAWVYYLNSNAIKSCELNFVGNNHKAPANWFDRKLVNNQDLLSALDNMIHRLKMLNPNIQFIFTISPVRHLREGFIANNRSKAQLIQVVHTLVEKFNNIHYFPAYELIMDDLRDYRFYAEDMVHPNYLATEYVWQALQNSCIDSKTIKIMQEIAEINTAMSHKPQQPQTQKHKQFLAKYLEKTLQISLNFKDINFKGEIEYFNNNQ